MSTYNLIEERLERLSERQQRLAHSGTADLKPDGKVAFGRQAFAGTVSARSDVVGRRRVRVPRRFQFAALLAEAEQALAAQGGAGGVITDVRLDAVSLEVTWFHGAPPEGEPIGTAFETF